MITQDIYLLLPEISIVMLSLVILLIDITSPRKNHLDAICIAGLGLSLILTVVLWLGVNGNYNDFIPEPRNSGILADTFLLDEFSLFFKVLFIAVTMIIFLISHEYADGRRRFGSEFYVLMMLSTAGMMMLSSVADLLTLYIALELATLPIAALATLLRDGRSSEAGLKFLVLSGISSAVLLYGLVLIYGFTGTTVLVDISHQLSNISLEPGLPFGSYTLLFAIVLIIAGFGFKITAVPFHMWAPDVYQGSPTPVTAFLAVASKSVGFAVLIRIFYIALPLDILSVDWGSVFAVLAALSMTVGNLIAISQNNIKRMLAYSSIAHAGYLMIGLAAVASRSTGSDVGMGLSGVLYYLAGYAAMNLATFGVVIVVSARNDGDQIKGFEGMARRAPFMAAVLAFAMVSLTGIPPTVGFMAKIYIFGAAINTGLWWLAVVGVVNSVVSAYYYLRIVKIMYFAEPTTTERLKFGIHTKLALFITTMTILILGVYPGPIITLAKEAVKGLI